MRQHNIFGGIDIIEAKKKKVKPSPPSKKQEPEKRLIGGLCLEAAAYFLKTGRFGPQDFRDCDFW